MVLDPLEQLFIFTGVRKGETYNLIEPTFGDYYLFEKRRAFIFNPTGSQASHMKLIVNTSYGIVYARLAKKIEEETPENPTAHTKTNKKKHPQTYYFAKAAPMHESL